MKESIPLESDTYALYAWSWSLGAKHDWITAINFDRQSSIFRTGFACHDILCRRIRACLQNEFIGRKSLHRTSTTQKKLMSEISLEKFSKLCGMNKDLKAEMELAPDLTKTDYSSAIFESFNLKFQTQVWFSVLFQAMARTKNIFVNWSNKIGFK